MKDLYVQIFFCFVYKPGYLCVIGYETGKYIDIPAFLLIEGNEEYPEWENSK